MKRETAPRGESWKHWLQPAAMLALSWVAVTCMALRPDPGAELVGIIFPPWWSATQAVAAAASTGAEIVRLGAVQTILVVRPARNDGIARLGAAGVLLAVDPLLAGGCPPDPARRGNP